MGHTPGTGILLRWVLPPRKYGVILWVTPLALVSYSAELCVLEYIQIIFKVAIDNVKFSIIP